MPQNDQALLTRLKATGLDFVVIGGVCVVFHGAPMATFDPIAFRKIRKAKAMKQAGVCSIGRNMHSIGRVLIGPLTIWKDADERAPPRFRIFV